jgi:hypothetical protein
MWLAYSKGKLALVPMTMINDDVCGV